MAGGAPGATAAIIGPERRLSSEHVVGVVYRIDQATVQNWIRSIIGDAEWAKVQITGL